MINKQEAISDIVENFNWTKVHKAMIALDWTWYDCEDGVPSIGALFKCAMNLLHEAYDGAEEEKEDYLIGTGGFFAKAVVDNETKDIIELRLSFEVTSWEHYE